MKKRVKQANGITLVALVVTIIVLIILAGVSISLILGNNGIITKAKEAGKETKEKSAIEKVELMLADYMPEKQMETKTLEEYLNEQKEKGQLEEVTNNNDGTITVEIDGYEITIKEDSLTIIETIKSGGVKPTFVVYITKTNGDSITPSEEETLEQKAITINITNIGEFSENYTIEVKDSRGNVLTKEANVISNVTGQESYIIKKSGTYTITVTGTKEGIIRRNEKTEKITLITPIIQESEMFSKANGVIDIVWLNTDNTARETPLSPAEHLGGLIPIKYKETTNEEETVMNPKTDDSWYDYVAQTGNTDGKTSRWANARSSDKKAYFVWIPRYAYKITYFNTSNQAKAYRENGSLDGIVGYSNIEGIVKVENGTEKLLNNSQPSNVTGKVQTSQYEDYIPHPAFEFDGSKARNMGRKI